ncbi:hypothetical protein C4578_04085 [Candidatus Microgenomates bacterium]|nr:MAG: hypothetical protein C4578_04085 [Candidatus Microgenomates bacterium]
MIIISTKFKKGFFIAPNDIFQMDFLSTHEKLVYLYLCRCGHNSEAHPSFKKIAENCSMGASTAKNCVKKLEDLGFIQVVRRRIDETHNLSNIYKVNEPGSTPNEQGGINLRQGSPTDGQEGGSGGRQGGTPDGQNKGTNDKTTINQITKDKYIPYIEIINYLNSVLDTKYKATAKSTQDLIKALWEEDYTFEDFKTVIDNKIAEWSNTEFSKYLRPATLFKKEKFEGYLNQKHRTFDLSEPGSMPKAYQSLKNWADEKKPDYSGYDFEKEREPKF